ncbi:phosphoglucomutase-2 isoform X1 [Harmonia axyridis]|uniref:phosphoglucomutase-2 isoform X1 n=2 Tax=Harmonia axyridis TaxID=115357 RepID=UPI001E27657F|nr:phosphoglucomutase-2 isoform X1 [Harmonia axyridis]
MSFYKTAVLYLNSELGRSIKYWLDGQRQKIMDNPDLKIKIAEWLLWDKNENTLEEIKNMISENDHEKLSNLLLNRLKFGTAGLRGKMQAGYAGMNDLVIIQTGQGLLKHLEKSEKSLLETNGIVIGYDGRHNSKRWAEITATIFVQAGYRARLFGNLVPTPYVPFSVRKYNCAIGIMITASHNPKEDNGYKVYASNGAQILSPNDKYIQEHIKGHLEPWPNSWETHIIQNNELIIDPLEEVAQDYTQRVKASILPEHLELNKKFSHMYTYTPMHGVGYNYVKRALDAINIRFKATPEQKDPHPDFPTVVYPNPEEGASCLDLSFKLAEKIGSTIIIANDPDADRMACAEKDSKTGKWKIFTGNELGALLGWWLLQCFKSNNPKVPMNDVYMVSSTVSSMILKTMAAKEGFNFVDTLTGFKWIGNKALELTKQGKYVIFGFEEAIGYMCGLQVIDKDGVSAACHMTTFGNFLKSQKKTLQDKLDEIYSTYGYHVSLNSYYICYYSHVIQSIFDRIRNYTGPKMYPKSVKNGEYTIKNIRDLTTGYDDAQADKKAILPVDPSSQMITFYFTNGLVVTLRTSGTEPKIKYYTEMCAPPEQTDREKIVATMTEQVEAVIREFLEPEKRNLIRRSS